MASHDVSLSFGPRSFKMTGLQPSWRTDSSRMYSPLDEQTSCRRKFREPLPQ